MDYISSQSREDSGTEVFMGLNDGTLADMIPVHDKSAHMDKAGPVFYPLLRALDFLDANGITHCDLKPENIQGVVSPFCAAHLAVSLIFATIQQCISVGVTQDVL